MKLYQVRKVSTILLLTAMGLGVGGYMLSQSDAGLSVGVCVAAVGCIAAYWVILMKFWRCPKCNALLPVKQHFYSVRHCPDCGEELDLNRW